MLNQSLILISLINVESITRKELEKLFHSIGYQVHFYPDEQSYLKQLPPFSSREVIIYELITGAETIFSFKKTLNQLCRLTPLVILSNDSKVFNAVSLMKAGVYYLYLKPCNLQDMMDLINKALRINLYDPQQLILEFKTLSTREREILDLVMNGVTSREIAPQLEISVSTVEAHRRNIHLKLNTSSDAIVIKKFMYLQINFPHILNELNLNVSALN
jgi:two-component system, LuxR family, response regulator FixJ